MSRRHSVPDAEKTLNSIVTKTAVAQVVFFQTAGGGDGMLRSRYHCQELCAAAA